VIGRLTDRQQEVLRLLAAGLVPQEVAERLGVTLKTVDGHKSVILAECRTAWELPAEAHLTYHWLREKFGQYFVGLGE
jgi:CRISPR-associated protein Csx14